MREYAREEFLDTVWDYRPGESVAIIGPTGAGKTHTAWQLIGKGIRQNPQLDITALQPKPADETTTRAIRQYGLEVRDSYPFARRLFQGDVAGHVHWPRHITTDEDANIAHLQKAFKASLTGEFWTGSKIVLVDDTYLIACYYKCGPQYDKYLIAGRSNKAGVVSCLQQPRGTQSGGSVSSFTYNQSTHMLLGKDGNAKNRERFAEIAMGIDPRLIDDTVTNLKVYRIGDSAVSQLLYLDRRGPYACIVNP